MELLNIIDQMSWKEYSIFFCVFVGLVNFVAWMFLMKRHSLKKSAEKLVSAINSRGFVDGGLVVILFFGAMTALIVSRETVSKESVVEAQKIEIDDKTYRCQPIRQRVIKYYDLEEKKTKPLPIPPKKECQK